MAKKHTRSQVSLTIPCYNEEKLLEDSVKNIETILRNYKNSYEIIFVDDCSTDKTKTIIQKLCKKNSAYKYIFHKQNAGRGKAVSDGMLQAVGKVVGYMDIDLEVSPVYVPLFVHSVLQGDDVVIGTRVYREDVKSLHRHILSKGYVWLVRVLLHIPFQDTEQGYKFFNRKKILPVLEQTKNQRWFWDTEILVRAYYEKLSVREIPVLFIRRTDKKSSVRVLHDTIDYLIQLLRFRKQLFSKYVKFS